MNTRCLMIKTKDKRKFFTHEDNFPYLIEFSKTFKAEISIVQIEDPLIMELPQLAPALCDASFPTPNVNDYQLIEIKMPVEPRKTRGKILRIASQIKKHVLKKFMEGSVVAIKDLRRRYKRYNLSVPCLSNHVSRVRQELNAGGKKVKRISKGRYQMEK